MRRSVIGLFVLIAAFGLILSVSCQRENALRIVQINEGRPLMSDIIDFGEISITEEGETEVYIITQIPGDIVEIELQYTELGLGLPSWTPYVAHINRIEVEYSDVATTGPPQQFEYDVSLPVDVAVKSDREGKKTTETEFMLVPAFWKEYYFADDAQDDPTDDDYGVVATLEAKVTVEGYDEASGQKIEAEGEATVIIGNFWDDPDRLGQ